ncbi:MAG: class I SAM-dependent methyltransferase [Actinobacteria bacterium]|nr:class I SAM-dependent methyltransferase [Actinomycetota bacterium]
MRVDLTYRRLRRRLRGLRIDRVLDVGCGDGALLRRFLDDGADVVGCDPGLLGRPVDERVSQLSAVHACTLDELPDSEPFDLVLAVHVVEHLPTAVPAWQSLLHRTRPGGTVYAVTPAADSGQLDAFEDAWWMLDDPTHVRFYSGDSLAQAALAAGAAAVVIRRPRDDSLMCEGMSVGNWLSDKGVSARVASTLGLLSAPVFAGRRMVNSKWSPVIEAWVTAS